MFSKLLKYDYRAMKKFGKPMFFIVLGLIIVGMLNSWLLGVTAMRMEMLPEGEPAFESLLMVISCIVMFMVIMALFMSCAAMLVLTLIHFYKSLVTDEGYLTFTLPVRASEILGAKLLSGCIWLLVFTLLAFVGFFAILFSSALSGVVLTDFTLAELLQEMGEQFDMFGEIFSVFGGWFGVLMALLAAVAGMVNSILLYYMVIFFASVIAKKNRVVTAIFCIIGANFAYGIIANIVTTIALVASGVLTALSRDPAVFMIVNTGIHFVLFSVSAVVFFFLTKHMMEKKLNLP